jgi:hypothetical protein
MIYLITFLNSNVVNNIIFIHLLDAQLTLLAVRFLLVIVLRQNFCLYPKLELKLLDLVDLILLRMVSRGVRGNLLRVNLIDDHLQVFGLLGYLLDV